MADTKHRDRHLIFSRKKKKLISKKQRQPSLERLCQAETNSVSKSREVDKAKANSPSPALARTVLCSVDEVGRGQGLCFY